ncbi:MAG: phosphatase PAP2 family protein [Chloroflexota bacterium]
MDPFLLSELDFIRNLQGGLGGLASIFKTITFLGNEEFYLLIIPLLYWCVDGGLGLRIGVMLIFSNVFNSALKLAFHSPRPYWVNSAVRALTSETSFGMPSGHAQNALSLWGLAAIKIRNTWFRWLAVVLIVLIGFSRIVLGVHFPSDVLVGWGVGGLLLTAYLQLEKPVIRWFNGLNSSRQFTVALASSLVILLSGFLVLLGISRWLLPPEWSQTALLAAPEDPIYPLTLAPFFTVGGTWLGFLSGLILMLRSGGLMNVKGSPLQLALRFLLGIAGVLVLYLGLGALFPREPEMVGYGFRFLRYSLIGFWISAAAPFLFLRLKLARRN